MFTSDELRELYQEVILDHNKHPRNFGVVEPCTHHAEGFNPLCGDHLTITMTMDNGIISDVRFQGDGCAISKATASLLTSEIKGKTQEEAERIIDIAQDAVTSAGDVELPPLLGKMSVIAGVREFPARVKCATLAMHTVKSALHGEHQATTE